MLERGEGVCWGWQYNLWIYGKEYRGTQQQSNLIVSIRKPHKMRSTNLTYTSLCYSFWITLCPGTRNLCKTGKELTRETREGWPLLTVKTEVNGDSKSTIKRGSSLVGFVGLSCQCQYKRFLVCLGCSSQPGKTYFFPHRKLFQFLCPQSHRPASWAGSRAR